MFGETAKALQDCFDENRKQYVKSKPWSDYPIRTRAYAVMGGYWEKTECGWKWCAGSTFPTPAGDWSYLIEPLNA